MGEAEQLAIFEKYAERAYEMALDSMAANYHRIVSMARARMTDGVTQYGSRMFEASEAQLHQETLEEYADAVNYWVARMWKADQR